MPRPLTEWEKKLKKEHAVGRDVEQTPGPRAVCQGTWWGVFVKIEDNLEGSFALLP